MYVTHICAHTNVHMEELISLEIHCKLNGNAIACESTITVDKNIHTSA